MASSRGLGGGDTERGTRLELGDVVTPSLGCSRNQFKAQFCGFTFFPM